MSLISFQACSASVDERLGVCCKEVFVGNGNESGMDLHDRKDTYLESNVGGNVRETKVHEKSITRDANINTMINLNPFVDKKKTKTGNIRLIDILDLVEELNDKQNLKRTDTRTKLKNRKKKENQIKTPFPENGRENIQLVDILSLVKEQNIKQTKKKKLTKPGNRGNSLKIPSEDMIRVFLNIKRNKFPGIKPFNAAGRKFDKYKSSTNMKSNNIRLVDILDMVTEMNTKKSGKLVTKSEKNIRNPKCKRNSYLH